MKRRSKDENIKTNNEKAIVPECLATLFIEEHNSLIVSTTENVISVWDLGTKLVTQRWMVKNTLLNMVWSVKAQRLYTCGTESILTFKLDLSHVEDRYVGHTDKVLSLVVLDNYDLLLSGGLDHKIMLWDLQDGRNKGDLAGHNTAVRSMVYSEANDILLTCGFDWNVSAWDIGNRELLFVLKGHRAPVLQLVLVMLPRESIVLPLIKLDPVKFGL